MLISNIAAVLSFTQAGKLRGLAVTGTARSKVAPDLPTVAESGLPGYEYSGWYGQPRDDVGRIPGGESNHVAHWLGGV